MWDYEHSIQTSAAPEDIWRLWADVENWGDWNPGVERIEIDGPFAPGTNILMTPPGEDPIPLRVAEVEAGELFVDEARFDDLLLRTVHRMEKLDGGRVRIVYRMEITGDGADQVGPAIGPGITADWPETMAALVERARR
ncbi:SRPBCC family protein [Paenarthrobacter sp. NPDC089316]|uniref:SRPBCC family protein n=1 Tax=unclassified Paenarthrobacter TaxID=2634190 RepID=UPI0034310705